MAKGTLSILVEKLRKEEGDPEELLKDILRFLHLKSANIDIYFLLVDSRRGMTINDISSSLNYSERTIRKYVKELHDLGYIKRSLAERKRPCYEYSAISPLKVWQKLVEEVRQIRIIAEKSISKFKKEKRFYSFR